MLIKYIFYKLEFLLIMRVSRFMIILCRFFDKRRGDYYFENRLILALGDYRKTFRDYENMYKFLRKVKSQKLKSGSP